jgi:hypothetical protein
VKVNAVDLRITDADAEKRVITLRAGKKRYHLLRLV